MDSQEDKLHPEIESVNKGSEIESSSETAEQAKTSIIEMTESANLPPDLQRQAEAAGKEATVEIDKVTAIPTTEDRVETKEKPVGDIGQLLGNISAILTEKVNKLSDDESNDWRIRKQAWDIFTKEVSKSKQPVKQRVVLLRNAFRTKFPELSDIAKNRINIQEEDFHPDLDQETKALPDFSQVKNLEELYEVIDKYGPIKGGLGTYDPEILKSIIQDAAIGKLDMDYVTETGGLREKVLELSKTGEQYLDKDKKLKILSSDELAKLSEVDLSKIRDTFTMMPINQEGEMEEYFNRVWDEIEKRHGQPIEDVPIKIVSPERLKELNQKAFDMLYDRLVGGSEAISFKQNLSTEEKEYIWQLIIENSRRQKDSKQPEQGVKTEEVKTPDFSQAKSLEDIYQVIDDFGTIKVENNRYSPDILKSIIKDIAEGKIGVENLVNIGNLRTKVEKITGRKTEGPQLKLEKELSSLSAEEFTELYKRKIGGKNAELIGKKKTPEEQEYFRALVREDVRRKEVQTKDNKKEEKIIKEQPVEKVKPNLENLRELISQLNFAFASRDRELQLKSLTDAAELLADTSLAKSETRREITVAIEKAVLLAENRIHQLEGSKEVVKPKEIEVKIELNGKPVSYKIDHYGDSGLAIKKIISQEDIDIPLSNYLVSNYKDFLDNSDLKAPGGSIQKELLLRAAVFSLFHKKNILFALEADNNLKEDLGKDILKEIQEIDKDYGPVLKSEIKQEILDFINQKPKENIKEEVEQISVTPEFLNKKSTETLKTEEKKEQSAWTTAKPEERIEHITTSAGSPFGRQKPGKQEMVDYSKISTTTNEKGIFAGIASLFKKKDKPVAEELAAQENNEEEINQENISEGENKITVNGINYYLTFTSEGNFVIDRTSEIEFSKYKHELPDNWQQLIKDHYPDQLDLANEIEKDFDKYAYTIFIFKNLLSTDKLNEQQKSKLKKTIENIITQWHDKYTDIFGKNEAVEEKAVSIPLMITKDMRQQLYDLGHSKAVVDNLKPEEAHKILAEKALDNNEGGNLKVEDKTEEIKDSNEEFKVPEFSKKKSEVAVEDEEVTPLTAEELGVGEVKPYYAPGQEPTVATANLGELIGGEEVGEVKPYNPPVAEIKQTTEKPEVKGNGKVIKGELKTEDKGFGEPKPLDAKEKVDQKINMFNTEKKDILPEENTEDFKVPEFLKIQPEEQPEIKESKTESIEEKVSKIPKEINKFSTEANGVNCDLTFYDNGTVELLRKGLSFHAKYEEDPISEVLNKKWQKKAGKLSINELNDIENTANDIYFKYRILKKMEDSRLAEMRSKLAMDIFTNMLRLLKYGNVVKDDFFSDRESFMKKVKKLPGQINESF